MDPRNILEFRGSQVVSCAWAVAAAFAACAPAAGHAFAVIVAFAAGAAARFVAFSLRSRFAEPAAGVPAPDAARVSGVPGSAC
jgi:hypothetical protein